jgi:hypothetical protein
MKVVLKGKFIAINAYIENSGRSQRNNFKGYLKVLEKQD